MTIIASSTSQSEFRLPVLLRLLIVFAASAVWMLSPHWQSVAMAQESASISGTVTDESGAPIEGIKVTAYRQVIDAESQMISWIPSGD